MPTYKVSWPWIKPSDLIRAVIAHAPEQLLPSDDYWPRMLLDFPQHPAGQLSEALQARIRNFNALQNLVIYIV